MLTPDPHLGADAPLPCQRPPVAPHVPSKDDLARVLADLPPLITVREAAKLLRCAPSTIHHRIARGELRAASRGKKPTLLLRDQLVRDYFKR